MVEGDKLYSVTRRDLKPGYQAVQAAHAYVQFTQEHPKVTKEWHKVSQYMGLLSVADERELFDLYCLAVGVGIKCSPFYEPDVGFQMTALALEPGPATAELCSALPLALKEYKHKRSR